ncbi:AlpA family phage regulatory protein [Curvibacter sp. RS43]|uniref:helix-turn-helix transcriptional regulator n=1 Tax=Curvibacter microcysteis TaxID=3026419 RepID=UPI0023625D9C|nr:AlpA family phage regulatory protein [Curvibacter sp. RS43]MDD0812190.1 AlpA family phage regulatory protein [Curvibacter sp. RS43]
MHQPCNLPHTICHACGQVLHQSPGRLEFDALQPGSFVRLSQLIPDVLPMSRATLWRKVKAKQFPAPVKLSGRITAWRVDEVRGWLTAQTKN